MGNDTNNVFVAKPKSGGAVFVAPARTALPTDAKTALSNDFACLGFISENGAEQETGDETQEFKAWGGEKVLTSRVSHEEKQKMTFIEQNIEVLKQVYGADNVDGTWEDGISVRHNNLEREEYVYVIETVLGKTRVNRLVIPRGKVMEVGGIVRKDNELFGYDATIDCMVDSEGNNAYEYFAQVATESNTPSNNNNPGTGD